MERLQKLIAAAGLCSRRTAEEWIRQGRVSLNGQTASIGESADPAHDAIKVDGKPIAAPQRSVYVMLNKPAGYVTTLSDPHAERTVMDLLRGCRERVFPVGRLDRDTTGLLLLTNDGDLAYRLSHPRFGVEKIYRAEVKGDLNRESMEKLRKGVLLEDGMTAPARVRTLAVRGGVSVVELVLHEGRKRQARRMLEAVGHTVLRLERIRYGPLDMGTLRPGEWRRLSAHEVTALREDGRRRAGAGGQGGKASAAGQGWRTKDERRTALKSK